jgi:glycosyltransferase involved in cell wall biosynthesis
MLRIGVHNSMPRPHGERGLAVSTGAESSNHRSNPMSRPGELRALMVYPEPAPYIVGLVDAIRSTWEGMIDVVFLHHAITQPWGYKLRNPTERALPSRPLEALNAIRRLLARNEYSLLHLAGWGHPVLLGALLLGSWSRIPMIVESDTPLSQGLPIWKRVTKEILYRLLFKLPAAFLPGGTRQAAYLRHYGVEEARIQIARMTVDVSRIFAYSESLRAESILNALHRYNIPDDHVRILYLGRLEPHKGLVDLLQAFGRLKQQIDGIALLIAGDGSMKEWIERQAAPGTSIYYLDRLSGERVWEAYAISDMFVLPSHFEPWGLVVNEAMAFGLPVIATDRVGCIDDLVRHEETGLIVPAESPDKLLVAIRALATDPDARRRMGTQAKREIAGWTLESAAKVTTAAWRKALGHAF